MSAGVGKRSNPQGLGPCPLVGSQVRILSPAKPFPKGLTKCRGQARTAKN